MVRSGMNQSQLTTYFHHFLATAHCHNFPDNEEPVIYIVGILLAAVICICVLSISDTCLVTRANTKFREIFVLPDNHRIFEQQTLFWSHSRSSCQDSTLSLLARCAPRGCAPELGIRNPPCRNEQCYGKGGFLISNQQVFPSGSQNSTVLLEGQRWNEHAHCTNQPTNPWYQKDRTTDCDAATPADFVYTQKEIANKNRQYSAEEQMLSSLERALHFLRDLPNILPILYLRSTRYLQLAVLPSCRLSL